MSIENKERYSISVGQYGHPLLIGARHWSILVEDVPQPTPWTGQATAYQISGSTETYEYATPAHVNLKEDSTYMGRINVGHVGRDQKAMILEILEKVIIIHGDLEWNCQNWVAAGLQALADAGINVKTYTQPEMRAMLQDIRA
ncbi:hypothetical protein CPB86DRAFT_783845 [Serendipita vermifera]|nr:hypothetical protein CPB86DRAFT_783845 [Serendipita vermifera]